MSTAKFELYPKNEPVYKGVNYLVIVRDGHHYSYAFRRFNDECEFVLEREGEEVVAFTGTDPQRIIDDLIR